ncbi:MAG TPA: hypothetical protein VFV38_37470 [Ktedonobacteraceae bacterium]|nr:hypothetical protein [Ktedonobacteraceae bacterium]
MQNETLPETRHALLKLSHIPVDHEYTHRLIPLLEAHGAVCRETHRGEYMKPLPQGGRLAVNYSEYEITFPPGTFREYGLRLMRSAPFVIYFPDGFSQPGSELYPLARGERDKPTVVLHLRP